MFQRTIRGIVCGGIAVVLAALGGAAVYTSGLQTVRIEDRCDPDTFNAAVGAGTCVEHERGAVTFDEFLQDTIENGGAPKWRFKPDEFHVNRGDSINERNTGGEIHTFTKVANFGAGVVPILNDLSGITGPPRAECIADLGPGGSGATLRFPGTTSASEQLNTVGTQKYQCCIHPWMRSTITVRER